MMLRGPSDISESTRKMPQETYMLFPHPVFFGTNGKYGIPHRIMLRSEQKRFERQGSLVFLQSLWWTRIWTFVPIQLFSDTSKYHYRDRNRKDLACWRISEEVGISGKLIKL
ncbi:hypothetical protein XENOCAPTIV_001785 [Xenoophorus captivus]|uniref:Uncharacterized protein n=1 Tax=Xenoophorus captivus TaxID=1517983 RepID=A0ABV0QFV1_9TELE